MTITPFASKLQPFRSLSATRPRVKVSRSRYAWGPALLDAALASMAGATAVTLHLRHAGGALRALGALLMAMVIFKVAIHGFGIFPGGNHGAWLPVATRYCATNLIAVAGLSVLYRVGIALGLAARPVPLTATVAH